MGKHRWITNFRLTYSACAQRWTNLMLLRREVIVGLQFTECSLKALNDL